MPGFYNNGYGMRFCLFSRWLLVFFTFPLLWCLIFRRHIDNFIATESMDGRKSHSFQYCKYAVMSQNRAGIGPIPA